MLNNTINCSINTEVEDMRLRAYFVIYYVITPLYFVISVSGNIIMLIAFHEQSKNEDAYVYQLLLTVSKTLEAFTYTTFVMVYKWWSDAESEGVEWFKGTYFLMWYTAHASIPLMNCFTTSSLLFSFVMATDRVLALAIPFKYKNVNHRNLQIIATIVCFSLGISSNIFDCFRYTAEVHGDGYTIGVDEVYLSGTAAKVLSQLRMALRITGLIGLIGLNVAMTILFRKRTRTVALLTHKDPKEQKQRDADKTLLTLTIWQSCLTCLAIVPVNCYYIMAYIAPNFTGCWGIVVIPFADLAFAVAEAADFFVVLAINPRLRRMILKVLRCSKSTVAVSISIPPPMNREKNSQRQ